MSFKEYTVLLSWGMDYSNSSCRGHTECHKLNSTEKHALGIRLSPCQMQDFRPRPGAQVVVGVTERVARPGRIVSCFLWLWKPHLITEDLRDCCWRHPPCFLFLSSSEKRDRTNYVATKRSSNLTKVSSDPTTLWSIGKVMYLWPGNQGFDPQSQNLSRISQTVAHLLVVVDCLMLLLLLRKK